MTKPQVRILLVEDNPDDAFLFTEMLDEDLPYHVNIDHVERLKQAISRVETQRYDVVFLDLGLPESKGLDTFRLFQPKGGHLPVILLTGLNDEDVALTALQEGAQDFLVKGDVDGKELSRAIRYSIERKKVQLAFEESEKRFRILADAALEGLWFHDKGKVLDVNRALCTMFGYKASELIGKQDLSFFFEPEPSEELVQALFFGSEIPFEATCMRKNGEPFIAEINDRPIPYHGKMVRVVVLRDITDRKRMEEVLQQHATMDSLTNLFNRRMIMDHLSREFKSSQRHDYPFSVCLIDLDKFKQINDTYGHQAGDEVLVRFAKLLKEQLRTENLAGRYGGDEFIILFPHTNASQAEIALERVRKALEQIVFLAEDGEHFSVTGTFGVAENCPEFNDHEELFKMADQALYAAKERGRNQVYKIEAKNEK